MAASTTGTPYAGWRAAAATVLVMAGASQAHTWAGGHAPTPPALLMLGVLVLGASSLVLRGSVRPWLLLPLVAAAQAVLHSSFVALDGAGHVHHAAEAAGSPWTWRMLLAHAAVTLLTAIVWRLCERAVADIVAATGFRATYAGGRRDPRRVVRTHRPLRTSFSLHLAPRRGPPALPGRA